MKKTLFWAWLLLHALVTPYALLNAQVPVQDVSLPSANASSLGRYGEVPVSKFTGIPKIEVPLYTLHEGSISLPLSLSYHAGGVMPDVRPGWTGLNFTLKAGGAISRIVRGIPDDLDAPKLKLRDYLYNYYDHPLAHLIWYGTRGGKAGYYFHHATNRGDNWNDLERMRQIVDEQEDHLDSEPDLFRFNFLGISGTFFMDHHGQWRVRSDVPVKVTFHEDNMVMLPSALRSSSGQYSCMHSLKGNTKTFGGFTLTTPDGTRYHFGNLPGSSVEDTDAIDYSIPFHFQLSRHWMATSWYLTRIEAPGGQHIDLRYAPDDYTTNMHLSYTDERNYVYDNGGRYMGYAYENGQPFDHLYTFWHVSPRLASYDGSLIRPVYLRKIKTSHEEIDFERSTAEQLDYHPSVYLDNISMGRDLTGYKNTSCAEDDPVFQAGVYWPYLHNRVGSTDLHQLLKGLKWKKLDRITIRGKRPDTKGLRFDFSYNEHPEERLMLRCVTESSEDGTLAKPPYIFVYYDGAKLPPYLSEAVDHWGYFNGNTERCFTLPRTQDFLGKVKGCVKNIQDLRAPASDLEVALAGTLKAIYYPTGGSTHFEYLQHRYNKYVEDSRDRLVYTTNHSAGGLRIRHITSKTRADDPDSVVKTYHYSREYDPVNGARHPSGVLEGEPVYHWFAEEIRPGTRKDKRILKETTSHQGRQPLGINSGSPHMTYPVVTEQHGDNGYIITEYSSFHDPYGPGVHFDDFLPGFWHFDTHTNVFSDRSVERGKPLRERVFDADGQLISEVITKYARQEEEDPARAVYYMNSAFFIYDNPDDKDSGVPPFHVRMYNARPYLNYSYKYLPIERRERDYSGQSMIEKVEQFQYNAAGRIARHTLIGSDGTTEGEDFRYAGDFMAQVTDGHCGTAPDCDCGTAPRSPVGTDWEKCMQDCHDRYRDCANISRSEGDYMQAIERLHRSLRDPLIETRAWRSHPERVTGGTLDLYLHQPLNGLIGLDKKQALALDSFHNVPFSQPSPDGYLTSSEDYRTEYWVHSYDTLGNPLEVRDRGGLTTAYIWGFSGTKPVARIKGAGYGQLYSILGNRFRLEGPLGNDLSTPQRDSLLSRLPATAEVDFYHYAPMKGMIATTDGNGRRSRLEHDALMRLSTVRDHRGKVVQAYEYGYAGETPPSCLELHVSGQSYYTYGDVIKLTAAVSGGKPPYTYDWEFSPQDVYTGDKTLHQLRFSLYGDHPSVKATCTVKDALGARAKNTLRFSIGPPPPYIDVLSPADGDTLKQGEDYYIRWDYFGEGSVDILLYKDGSKKEIIESGIPLSEGMYIWRVNAPVGTDYGILIRGDRMTGSSSDLHIVYCSPHHSRHCYNGNSYWYNSCGEREGLFMNCEGRGCSGGNCAPRECIPDRERTPQRSDCCSGTMIGLRGNCGANILPIGTEECPPGINCYCGASKPCSGDDGPGDGGPWIADPDDGH